MPSWVVAFSGFRLRPCYRDFRKARFHAASLATLRADNPKGHSMVVPDGPGRSFSDSAAVGVRGLARGPA